MKRSRGIAVLSLYFIAINLITLDYIAGFHWGVKAPILLALSCFFMNTTLIIMGEPLSIILAVLLVLLGIFLFFLREIARKIFIYVQGLSILGGFCIAPVEIARWSGGGSVAEHAPAIVFYSVVFNLVPALFIIFFTRAKVKEQFR
ncbi:MAG: hypothetical protein ABH891_00650 [Candidatus Omnitrophota bacterium]